MLGHRVRRWPNIKPAFGKHVVFAETLVMIDVNKVYLILYIRDHAGVVLQSHEQKSGA